MFGINKKIDKAINLYDKGEFDKSLSLCLRILNADSENSSILITAGNIFYVRNDYDSAIKYYTRVLKKNPAHYSALVNMSNSCFELKRYDDALYYAARALRKDKTGKLPYIILGNSYFAKEDYPRAVFYMEKAAELDSSDPWIYNTLSQAYQKSGDYIASLSNAWKAVEKAPAEDDAQQINLGYLFYEIALEKGVEVITECVDLWYKKYGRNPLVSYMANSLFGSLQIKEADRKYVQNIFDVFAPDFDSVLAALDYQAPSLIQKMMEEIYPDSSRGKLRILDLGCGTGLCGGFLRKYAAKKSLDGVDLSAGMLAAAAGKKYYTTLVQNDIKSFLEDNNNHDGKTYDLMVAADVFTYIGELQELFENINKSLRPAGRIIFTVSENTENKNNYFLHMSGRFLHSLVYIKNILKNTCFELEFYERRKLRNEGGKAVMGYVISARKKD